MGEPNAPTIDELLAEWEDLWLASLKYQVYELHHRRERVRLGYRALRAAAPGDAAAPWMRLPSPSRTSSPWTWIDESGPWMLVRRVLQSTDGARGLKAAMVTRMLHRKRPLFVPIFDSKVAAFYGATSSRQWRLWPALPADVRSATDLLDGLRAGVTTPDGRPR